MRKRLLLSAAVAAAALVALMLPTSSASADGNTTISVGPGQYTLGFTHPSGTISIGGGTVSARCAAASVKGSSVNGTPNCETRLIRCPFTASSCSLVANLRESAARGPVAFFGIIFFNGGFSSVTFPHPYDCPQATTCSWRVAVGGITPGTTWQSLIVNIANPNFPNVFNQLTLTVN